MREDAAVGGDRAAGEAQWRLALRVRRQPKGPGRSIEVVRRPVLLWVCRGPLRPPVVMDQERLLMFSRTPGRMRKLLRNVSGMCASFPMHTGYPSRPFASLSLVGNCEFGEGCWW